MYLTTRTTSCGVLMSPRDPSIGLRALSKVRGSPPDVLCNKKNRSFHVKIQQSFKTGIMRIAHNADI